MPPKTKDVPEPGSKPVTFRLNMTRIEQVAQLCQEQHRSQANMVQMLIEERLDQILEEKRKAK